MSSKYTFAVPRSRGITTLAADQEALSAQSVISPSSTTSVKDLILHALLVRIAFDDDCTEEFRTTYDELTRILDVDIPGWIF